jgi:K+-transporting ATPase ATPase A chain
VATTDASNGSVNSMHDSYQPLAMVAPMFNIAVGEVIWAACGAASTGCCSTSSSPYSSAA